MALSSQSAGRLFSDVWRDLRYAARTLRQQPAFTAAAVLTLALGIGATSAIFSLVDTILLRPLPFRDADRLVFVTGSYPKGAVVAMRDEPRTLDVAAYSENHDINLTGRGDPFRVTTAVLLLRSFRAPDRHESASPAREKWSTGARPKTTPVNSCARTRRGVWRSIGPFSSGSNRSRA